MRNITRRSVVLAGLGAAALMPACAMADIVTRTGYKTGGEAYEGLVTVEGETYLYEGGVKFCAGLRTVGGSLRYFHTDDGRMARDETVDAGGERYRFGEDGNAYTGLWADGGKTYLFESGKLYKGGKKDYQGSRYFHADDGRMAASEDVKWPDGTTHHYDADGVLNDAPATTELGAKDLAAGWYTLESALGGVLDTAYNNTADGSHAQRWDANGGWGQRWRVMFDPSVGAWRLENSASVVEAGNAGFKDPGERAALWHDLWKADGTAYAHQRWRMLRYKDGKVAFVNADNGFALTAHDKGKDVTMDRLTHGDGQKWSLSATASHGGWWSDGNGKWHVNSPSDGMICRDRKLADPVYVNGEGKDDGWGSVYDFDHDGNASWHLPTYDDLPGGSSNHGQGHAVPSITEGDRRQRSILYALSRVGCPYANGNRPNEFVCDGLTGWAVNKGAAEDWGACDDASYQWALIKQLHGDPWHADMGRLKPGDLVFWGDDSGKPLTYYAGAFGTYGYGNYHAGMYYADGKMINARTGGVTDATPVAEYSSYFGWAYLGGGSPYRYETCRFEVPHR